MSEVGHEQVEGKMAERLPEESVIREKLEGLLQEVDMNVTTEKMLRKELEHIFGVDLKGMKAFIREEIGKYLEGLQQEKGGTTQDEEDDDKGEEDDDDEGKEKRNKSGYILSYELSEFLGTDDCSRHQVVKRLWEYIKAHELQDPKNKRRIILDDKLKKIFPGKSTDMFKMNKALNKHVFIDDTDYVTSKSTRTKSKKADKFKKVDERNKTEKKKGESSQGKPLNGFTKHVQLSPELQAWLGVESCSRPDIIRRFWMYIKEHKLQDESNKKFVLSDDVLYQLTGEKRFQAFGFSKLIKKHILGYVD